MANDSCRRAWEAMRDLCGGPRENEDKNTFYIQVVMAQGREVTPRDTDEVAEVIEEAAQSIAITLALTGDETIDIQVIEADDRSNTIEAYIKIPVDRMPVRQVGELDQAIIESIEAEQVDVGRGLENIDMVDRSVVAQKVPEMIGPPIEDVEVM